MLLFSCDVAFLIVRSPMKHREWTTVWLPYLHGCVGRLPRDRPCPGKSEIVWFSTRPSRARRIVPALH
jgi:hypothetical protein